MRITEININPILNFQGRKRNQALSHSRMFLICDVFEKSKEQDKEPGVVNLRIKQNPRRENVPFGVNHQLEKLDNSFIADRMEKIPYDTKEAARESVFAGLKTKETFDEKFGKDNYVLISLGTSPAGVAKAMEFMGVDVRYLPISYLDELFAVRFEEFPNRCNSTGKYLDYLDSIDLNKENIEEDKRHYILLDFTSSGDSLKEAYDIASVYLDIKSPNLHAISINDTVLDNPKFNIDEQKRMAKYKNEYMIYSKMQDYCGIPHLDYRKLDNIETLLTRCKNAEETNFEIALLYYLRNNKI